MELVAAELASRLVSLLLRPSSLAVYVVVSLAVATGVGARVSLLLSR